jgi:protein-disulfide isomerase
MRPTHALTLAAALTLGAGCDDAAARPDGGDPVLAAGRPAAPSAAPAPDSAAVSPAQTVGTELSEMGFTRGTRDAPIAVVEFSDFGCPYCARFARGTLPILTEEFIDRGTVRWRYVPVVFGFAGGELMGAAAVCAGDQGGVDVFWRVHDMLYTRQAALRSDDARPRLLDWLAELGLDRDTLDTCIDAPATAARLRAHTRMAVDWNVRGTPTFLVNGVPMAGALPVDFFRKVFATVLDPSGL